MSFTDEIMDELLALPVGKTCCRKALIFGLFVGAKSETEGSTVSAVFKRKGVLDLALELLKKQFSATAILSEGFVGGRKIFKISVKSKALSSFIDELETGEKTLRELVGFRCSSCSHEFLRGVFLSSATVNDPYKGYHLELSVGNGTIAESLRAFLTEEISAPKKIVRASGVGVYYKSNGSIGDLLYYIGATKTSFDFANAYIERDIRNTENRATNCVARNISRSVTASQKHIAAIEYLVSSHKMESLSEELRYTAELRMENDSASLSELAMMHTPPITKSGLNQRLNKLLAIAQEIKENENKKPK